MARPFAGLNLPLARLRMNDSAPSRSLPSWRAMLSGNIVHSEWRQSGYKTSRWVRLRRQGLRSFDLTRRKPPQRIVTVRSRNNRNRAICATPPTAVQRADLAATASYGCYSKHKLHPTAYKLTPYAGIDVDRTYCDGHAGFTPVDLSRIPALLKRGILAGLWREGGVADGPPDMLWTIDDNGWIYELPITNAGTVPGVGRSRAAADPIAGWSVGRGGASTASSPTGSLPVMR